MWRNSKKFTVGDFRVGSDNKYYYVVDKEGNTIRRFSDKYTLDEVRLWRDGFVRGLNLAVGSLELVA